MLEHDLNDEETEQPTRELETLGLEVGQRAAKEAGAKEAEKEKEVEVELVAATPLCRPAPPTASSSSSPTSAATSCWNARRRCSSRS